MFPGFRESGSVAWVLLPVVGGLELGRRDVADRFEQPTMVEPVDPFERPVLDVVDPLPRAACPDQLGLVRVAPHAELLPDEDRLSCPAE